MIDNCSGYSMLLQSGIRGIATTKMNLKIGQSVFYNGKSEHPSKTNASILNQQAYGKVTLITPEDWVEVTMDNDQRVAGLRDVMERRCTVVQGEIDKKAAPLEEWLGDDMPDDREEYYNDRAERLSP